MNLVQYKGERGTMIRLAHDLIMGRGTLEIVAAEMPKGLGKKKWLRHHPNDTPEGLMHRLLRVSYNSQGAPGIVDELLALEDADLLRVFQSLPFPNQERFLTHLEKVGHAFTRFIDRIDRVKHPPSKAAVKRVVVKYNEPDAMEFANMRYVLSRMLYEGRIRVKVRLDRPYILEILTSRGIRELPARYLLRLLEKMRQLWGASPGKEESPLNSFVRLLEEVRRDFGCEKFLPFLERLMREDDSNDPVDLVGIARQLPNEDEPVAITA